eukprot:m.129251 g.129251  ORF g.129251 m.129251 type:complete len:309 (-) comp16754_c4_seq1:1672-2598(-)
MASGVGAAMVPRYCIGTLKGHEGAVMAVRYNSDGDYCLTAGRDRTMRLWNPLTQLEIKVYRGHSQDVTDCAASKDARRLLSGSKDKNVLIWDVASGESIRKYWGHAGPINSVKFNEEAVVAVSGSYDGTVRCWDLRSNNRDPIQTLNEAKDSISSVFVSGSNILTGSVDGHVRLYDLRAGRLRTDFIGEPVTSVSLSHDGNCILAGSLDSTIRLLDKDTGKLLSDYSGHKSKEFKVECCLSHNDAYVVGGSEDGKVFIWELVEGNVVHTIDCHSIVVSSLGYHPKKPMLLTASVDGQVKVWSYEAAAT